MLSLNYWYNIKSQDNVHTCSLLSSEKIKSKNWTSGSEIVPHTINFFKMSYYLRGHQSF